MDLMAEGIQQGFIRFEDNQKYIVYVHQDKRRHYVNPEEVVQAESFLRLVLPYKYPVKHMARSPPSTNPATDGYGAIDTCWKGSPC